MPSLIAVTGASGWVGTAVCDWLESRGESVRRLVRQEGGARAVLLDLDTPASSDAWRRALTGVDTLIHCAAYVHRPNETPAESHRFRQVNMEGTARLLTAACSAGVHRVVLASSAAVYDWSAAEATGARESSPVAPPTAYARSKLEAEMLVRASGLDWRIARLGTVFGVGDRANFWRLAAAMGRRRFVLPGPGAARKSVLPVQQAGEGLGRLALEPDGEGLVVNLADPIAPSLREICTGFARCCGFSAPIALPLPLLRVAAIVGDGARALRLPAPLTTATLAKLTTSTVLNVSQLRELWPEMAWKGFDASLAEAADYYAHV